MFQHLRRTCVKARLCFRKKGVFHASKGDGREVRRYWVNFQCRCVLLVWIIVGQGPFGLAVGAGGG